MGKPADISVGPRPEIYDHHICECGEAPLWHPLRHQLYWVDVTTHEVLTHTNGKTERIPFKKFVTALAWIDTDHLLVATETGLDTLNLESFETAEICPIESDNSATRSNDGRADPWGGFWISTMGKSAEHNAGKIYRYYNGSLSVIVDAVTIPNAICFSPKKDLAYFADTATKKFYKIELDVESGTPLSTPKLCVDFEATDRAIDGAIVDQSGHIYLGVWDGYAILKINPDGEIVESLPTAAARPTCPAFGGKDYKDIFVTTAAIGLHSTFEEIPQQGKTLCFVNIAKGQAEPPFILNRAKV